MARLQQRGRRGNRHKVVGLALGRGARTSPTGLLLDAGVDIIKVKELLGHWYVTTTQTYDERRRSLKEGASHDLPI